MGREVRRVPADWQHPTFPGSGTHAPLFDGKDYARRVREWDEGVAKWAEGLRREYLNGEWEPIGDTEAATFEEWDGPRPDADDYMPRWTDAERTHLMMYETTSEGTPISPAFATPEDLARWLVDSNVCVFADLPALYDDWLALARGQWVPTFTFEG